MFVVIFLKVSFNVDREVPLAPPQSRVSPKNKNVKIEPNKKSTWIHYPMRHVVKIFTVNGVAPPPPSELFPKYYLTAPLSSSL
jgi:hypothetical protein